MSSARTTSSLRSGRSNRVGIDADQPHNAAARRLDSGEGQKLIRTIPRKGSALSAPCERSLTPATGHRSIGEIHEPLRPGLRCPTAAIAVLPFTNMSGDPEQEYFSDGISEDIITALSKLRWSS